MPSNTINRRLFLTQSASLAPLIWTGSLSCTALAAAEVPTLKHKLHEYADKFVGHLRDRGVRNLGVLKFRVKKGREPISDSIGTLNHSLGESLSAALILAAHDCRPQMGIIANANSVARQRKGATHLTAKGRAEFLADQYELAWKSEPVKADAFLTGLALTGPKLKQLRVVIQWFDRFDNEHKLRSLADFSVPMNADLLNEMSESFGLRGGFDGGKVTTDDAVQNAVAVKNSIDSSFPLDLPGAPVELDVLYNGQVQRPEFRDGKAFMREPQREQKVEFVLRHTDRRGGPLGVVLKVNGENTLFRERKKDFACSKWILTAGRPTARIAGYQKSLDVAEAFKVLSKEESARNEVNYGADVGTFSISVFRKGRLSPDIDDDAADLAAIANPVFPREKPADLESLQETLRPDEQLTSRGIVDGGPNIGQPTAEVEFEPEAVPILSATIHYYQRQR